VILNAYWDLIKILLTAKSRKPRRYCQYKFCTIKTLSG